LDVSGPKLRALDAMAARLGVSGIVVTRAVDLRTFSGEQQRSGRFFDRVLLDAPCSGLD